jgi:molecular chaperone IbpA
MTTFSGARKSAFDSLFNDPSFIGFDRMISNIMSDFERVFDASNYPPYNLYKTSIDGIEAPGDDYVLEFALAGFTRDELSVTLEDKILSVSGVKTKSPDRGLLHRGIAARSFVRKFPIADDLKVEGVTFQDGLLKVWLRNNKPEKVVTKFEIKDKLGEDKPDINNNDKQLLTE